MIRSVRLWCVALLLVAGNACGNPTDDGGTEPVPPVEPAPPVTVSSVAPTDGPLAGGTDVTISGTNFPARIDSVRVGDRLLRGTRRVSAATVTGTTPSGGTAQEVDIVVYVGTTASTPCVGCFTYNRAIVVSSVRPDSGPTIGGGIVTISGTNFPDVIDSVRVGGARVTGLSRISPTELAGVLPPGTAGPRDVTVYARRAGLGTCSGCFRFYVRVAHWTDITVGSAHACGLQSDGMAFCWGRNVRGQLGIGTVTDSTVSGPIGTRPLRVAGNITFRSLSTARDHTCGLTAGGTAYCWGQNEDGQLGDGTTAVRAAPVAVTGGLTFIRLIAMTWNTCGLTGNGTSYCWGNNTYGQLGNGSNVMRTTPTAVSGGLSFTEVVGSATYACGLTSNGTGYCWGRNTFGELGDGTLDPHITPQPVTGGISFTSVVAGGGHVCGLAAGGAAYCWGYNAVGELGDGTRVNRSVPTLVSGGLAFTNLSVGGDITCGLVNAAAYCWGSNSSGALGDGSFTDRDTPVAVIGALSFSRTSTSGGRTCGVTTTGDAYCWGAEPNFEVGNGSYNSTGRATPSRVIDP